MLRTANETSINLRTPNYVRSTFRPCLHFRFPSMVMTEHSAQTRMQKHRKRKRLREAKSQRNRARRRSLSSNQPQATDTSPATYPPDHQSVQHSVQEQTGNCMNTVPPQSETLSPIEVREAALRCVFQFRSPSVSDSTSSIAVYSEVEKLREQIATDLSTRNITRSVVHVDTTSSQNTSEVTTKPVINGSNYWTTNSIPKRTAPRTSPSVPHVLAF